MLDTGSEKKQSLPSASIVVLEKMDSAFVKGTASDKNGRFTLTYQPQKKKEYLLKVSFMGMQSFYRALGDSVSINAGTIVLKDDDLQIDEVVVTGKLREVVMEGDTHLNVNVFGKEKLLDAMEQKRPFIDLQRSAYQRN